jgi:putative phage-type endonuclease
MNMRNDFLEARKSGIGGSDMAAVLGLSRWKTPLDLYLEKTGEAKEKPMTAAMEMGIEFEPVISNWYAKKTGHAIQRINSQIKMPGRPHLIANVDRVVVTNGSRARLNKDGVLIGADGVVEIKTASAFKNSEWGSDEDDEIPIEYVIQAMHYLAVTGLEWCDVACYVLGSRKIIKRVERDEETIREMIDRADVFWHRHVLAGLAPEPVNAADVVKLYPQDNGTLIEADADLLRLINEARDIRARVKADEQSLDSLTDAIKGRLGEATGLAVQGAPILTWKAAKGSRKTDWKSAFERVTTELGMSAEWIGDFVESATTSQPGSRRLLWKD